MIESMASATFWLSEHLKRLIDLEMFRPALVAGMAPGMAGNL